MANDSSSYGMTQDELNLFLSEQRENGFQALAQDKRLFALEFVATSSVAQSAQAASITAQTGHRWLRDPVVSAFIHYLNQQKEHYSLIDASFVESQYLCLLSKLLGEEAVPMVDKEGRAFEAKKFEGAAAVSCLRDLAKISGHYKEEGSTINVQVTTLTPAQQKFLDEKLNSEY